MREAIENQTRLDEQRREFVAEAVAARSEAIASGEGFAAGDRLDIRVGSRIDEVERSLIEATLGHFKGNKRRAADALGCSLKTLYNKLNGYSQNPECANS